MNGSTEEEKGRGKEKRKDLGIDGRRDGEKLKQMIEHLTIDKVAEPAPSLA